MRMINLLPPQIKAQVHYAKRNAKLIGLVRLLVFLAIVCAVGFLAGHWLLDRTMQQTRAAQTDKDREIQAFSGTEAEAKALSERLRSVKLLSNQQTKFSLLLADLARVTPRGAYINTISLTEDSKRPVSINATADSYQTAAGLRDAFASSEHIKAVDIGSITNPDPGVYRVELSISFKAEQFK
jgi:Tfp pilus assembly protein PilN